MEQDQDLKNLFQRLDRTIDELPPPAMDARISQEIHRFRSPMVKFLEWVINGGAGMTLLFGLVCLSSIFWNGVNFGWVVLPLVLFLMRPLLGETPVQRPWRMAAVLTLGSVLSMALATTVDFSIYCHPGHKKLAFLSFFVENSVRTMFHPEYSLVTLIIVTLAVLCSQWSARRYPWLERKSPTKTWRSVFSVVILLLITGLFIGLASRAELVQYRQGIQASLQDPQMAKFAHGDNLADGGSAVAEELTGVGVPVEREARVQFLQDSDTETRKSLASILVKGFQEREQLLTRDDLWFSAYLLQSVANSEEAHPDLVFTELWWKLHCFAQDYAIGDGVGRLADRTVKRVALPSFLAPALSPEETKLWYNAMLSRPVRAWDTDDTAKLLAVYTLLVKPRPQDKSHSSYMKHLADVEDRLLLMVLTHREGLQIPGDYALFGPRYTKSKRHKVTAEIQDRELHDEDRSLLIGVLEARLTKMKTGHYPETLKARMGGYRYELSPDGPVFNKKIWPDGEEIVCRLPR